MHYHWSNASGSSTSLSETIHAGADFICLRGAFSNMIEHINMTHVSKSVTIYGNFAFFVNSSFSFTSLQEERISVTITDLTIENSTVVLRNVAVEFTNCTFINVIITDIGSSDVKTSHIQIDMRHTTFRCDENDQQYPYGIQLHSFSIARLSISLGEGRFYVPAGKYFL